MENMVEHINDIAGVRIVCSFTSDIYRLAEMIGKQKEFTILYIKDYMKHPKESGYRSYHIDVYKRQVCGAFIGSLFIIKPTFLNMNIVPSLIGLCGGLCDGIAYTMVRVLGQRGQKGVSVVLFFS